MPADHLSGHPDSVTAVGPEDDASVTGVGPAETAAIWNSVCDWYRMGTTPAIQICLRRGGGIVLNRAIGHGWGTAPAGGPDTARVPITVDTPFCGFSTAKGVAAVVMAMLIEQG
ncbi:MAG: serine hydrolase, partial [Nocardia sp.]|nr:serine hydrolase [Nocardia sp.]